MLDVKKTIRIAKAVEKEINEFAKKNRLNEADALRRLIQKGLENEALVTQFSSFENTVLEAILGVKKEISDSKINFSEFKSRFAKWAEKNGAMTTALLRANRDGAEKIFEQIFSEQEG